MLASTPAAASLNLEYAREWKAGGLERPESTADDLIFVQLARRTNVFSIDAIYADIGEYFILNTALFRVWIDGEWLSEVAIISSTKARLKDFGAKSNMNGSWIIPVN